MVEARQGGSELDFADAERQNKGRKEKNDDQKVALLATLILAISSVGLAQSRKTIAPNVIVKNLYAAHKAGRESLFPRRKAAPSLTSILGRIWRT